LLCRTPPTSSVTSDIAIIPSSSSAFTGAVDDAHDDGPHAAHDGGLRPRVEMVVPLEPLEGLGPTGVGGWSAGGVPVAYFR
jgi:hypothetical protein